MVPFQRTLFVALVGFGWSKRRLWARPSFRVEMVGGPKKTNMDSSKKRGRVAFFFFFSRPSGGAGARVAAAFSLFLSRKWKSFFFRTGGGSSPWHHFFTSRRLSPFRRTTKKATAQQSSTRHTRASSSSSFTAPRVFSPHVKHRILDKEKKIKKYPRKSFFSPQKGENVFNSLLFVRSSLKDHYNAQAYRHGSRLRS